MGGGSAEAWLPRRTGRRLSLLAKAGFIRHRFEKHTHQIPLKQDDEWLLRYRYTQIEGMAELQRR